MTGLTPAEDLVTVYGFRYFDITTRSMQLAGYKATPEAIKAMPRAAKLPATGEKVPRQAVDSAGRFRRQATGWGDLA